jgi:hypothetical protein
MLLYKMNLNVPIAQQVPQIQEGISNSIGAVTNTVGSAAAAISDVRGAVNNSVQDFASKDLVGSSNEFLQTNTLIAKFVFLIFVLIAFLILMNLGIYLLSYFLQPNTSPHVINGIRGGNENKVYKQNPKLADSVTIYRSNNQTTGMEYTWSFWLKSKSPVDTAKKYSHVFSKGLSSDPIAATNPRATPDYSGQMPTGNNAPGVYLSTETTGNSKTNTLTIVMDTVDTANPVERVTIPNIPLNKWIHVAIRLQNKILDVYINGMLKKRVSFQSVPKQNYGDIFLGKNGGFDGQISNLQYFDRALNVFQISNITTMGPNMKPVPDVVDTSTDYLSSKWF